jgi:hypothetical protein
MRHSSRCGFAWRFTGSSTNPPGLAVEEDVGFESVAAVKAALFAATLG